MIITAVGAEQLIAKLKEEIQELEKEIEEHGNVLRVVLEQGRKELIRYKLIGYKKKPPQR